MRRSLTELPRERLDHAEHRAVGEKHSPATGNPVRSRTERPEPAWLAPSPRLAAWGFGAKPRSFRPEATLSVRAIPPAEARTERAGRFQFSFARRHHKAQAEQLIPTRAELPILANATPASFLSLAANQSSPFGSHAGKSGTNSTLITVKAVAAIHPSYTTLFLWIVLARPRSHKRGNGVCRGTRRRRRRSFNGAALSRARKCAHASKAVGLLSKLQRGRALASAEIQVRSAGKPSHNGSFNGAALSRARKCTKERKGPGCLAGFNGAALSRARTGVWL